MSNPQLFTPTSWKGYSGSLALTGTEQTLISNAASSGKLLLVRSLQLANNKTTAAVEGTVKLVDSGAGTSAKLAPAIAVQAQSTEVIIGKDSVGCIYLNEGQSLTALAGETGQIDATWSYDEVI